MTVIGSVARNGKVPDTRNTTPSADRKSAPVSPSAPSAPNAARTGAIRGTAGRRARAATSNTKGISARRPSRSTTVWCSLLA